ncbi:hypothetical protein DV738_g4621, partial [Chaetothyriales sp. CBS 135597]
MDAPFWSSENLQDQDNSTPTPSLKREWDELEDPSQESWAPLFPSGADEIPEYPSKRCCCGFEDEDEDEDEKIEINLPKCISCLEDIESTTWATMSTCEHTWCSDCISQNIQQAIKSRRSWPPRCCDAFADSDLEQAKKLIKPELVREWEARQEELTTRNPTYCPRPECQAFIRNSSQQQPKGARFVLCWSCQHSVCVECKTGPSEHNKRSTTTTSDGLSLPVSLLLQCPSRIGEENEKLCDADFCYRCGDGLVAPLYQCRPECGEDDDEVRHVFDFLFVTIG